MPTHKSILEVVRWHELKSRNLSELDDWPEDRIRELIQEFSSVAVDKVVVPHSEFVFTVNAHLSGAASPCPGDTCRLPPVQDLARFAALYADYVIVRDPFEDYAHYDNRAPITIDDRMRLLADISVVLAFEPLLDAGLVAFSSPQSHWCPLCVYRADRKGELAKMVGAEGAAGWEKRVSAMVEYLRKELLGKSKASVALRQGKPELNLTSDVDLVPHGSLVYDSLDMPKSWLKDLRKGGKKDLTSRQLWQTGVLDAHIRRIIDDISIQNHYASLSNVNYVTDRTVDLALANLANDTPTQNVNKTMIEALAHGLPFMDSAKLADILRVRNAEGEAFRVYRDAMTSAMATARTASKKEAEQAFSDLVRPEINKIDLLLRNARTTIAKGAATELGLGVAAVAIALFSGILPAHWAEIFTAVGGAAGLKAVVGRGLEAGRIPKEVRDNRFFFLWKLRRQAGKKKARS